MVAPGERQTKPSGVADHTVIGFALRIVRGRWLDTTGQVIKVGSPWNKLGSTVDQGNDTSGCICT